MSVDTGKLIGSLGIILALIGLNVSNESGQETKKEHEELNSVSVDTNNIVSSLVEKLGNFRITLGGATANAAQAPGNLDYHSYLNTERAKIDLDEIDSYFRNNKSNEKAKLLKELTSQLKKIESDYKNELSNISTVSREIKRTEGILLSHRRQIGVIVTAIKMVNPPPHIYALANDVEVMLSETI